MKGMGDMMKQAQKLQARMLKMQEELAEKTVESAVGGGMIKVVANGRQQVVSIRIEKEVVNPEDVEMLQDLVLAAVNEAIERSQALASDRMGALTGGLPLRPAALSATHPTVFASEPGPADTLAWPLGHGRGAALGDTLCRILSFCGYDVSREFYINDAGQQ